MQTESITIHATYDDILLPAAHLREILMAQCISEEIIKSCEEALNKLLRNIVEYAYHKDEQQLITVSITYNDSGVYIETQDEGAPIEFSINKVIEAKNLQPASETEEQAADKKDILDEVWYEVDMGKNIWQLVKYI